MDFSIRHTTGGYVHVEVSEGSTSIDLGMLPEAQRVALANTLSEAAETLDPVVQPLLDLLNECRDFFNDCPSYDSADTNNLDTRCGDAIAKAERRI